MAKLIVRFDEAAIPASNSVVLRVSAAHYGNIAKAAHKCGISIRQMASILLQFALDRLVLEKVSVYNPGFTDSGEDALIKLEETSEDPTNAG